jgi:PAS domain S-box-containing protein
MLLAVVGRASDITIAIGRLEAEVERAVALLDTLPAGRLHELARLREALREAKLAAKVSERERAVLRYIIASIPHSVFWKDRQSTFLGVNDNLLRDLGLRSADEIVGKTDLDTPVLREEAELFRQKDKEVMDAGRAVLNFEETQHRADGTHTLLTSKVPLRDDIGETIGILGIYVDISERKRMESELRDAKEAAEAAVRAKSEFLKLASQELRTPLALILGPLRQMLASREVVSEGQGHELAGIHRNAERLERVLSEVLDLARIAAGAMAPASEPIDADALMVALVDQARPAAVAAGVTLALEATEPVGRVPLDTRLFEKIAFELMDHALAQTPPSGRVTVRSRRVGPWFELAVTDTGPGIARHELGVVFERSRTLAREALDQRRPQQGWGIGLSLVRELAELMGGTAAVESELGKGSSFLVRLPGGGSAESGTSRRATTVAK